MQTTFNQIIGDNTFTLTVPQNRVETLCDRIDSYIESGNLSKALAAIQPFLGGQTAIREKATPTNRGEAAAKIIEENRSMDKGAIVKILMQALDITYANAHYYVRKAGV